MKKNILFVFAFCVLIFSNAFAQTTVSKTQVWYAPACKPKLYGLQDNGGISGVEAKFDHLEEGDGNGWIAQSAGKYGVINSSGNWIIKPNYEIIVQFLNGKAVVGKKSKTKNSPQDNSNTIYFDYESRNDSSVYFGVVDVSNTWIVDATYEFIRLSDDGSAQYTDGSGKFGFLNPDGTVMLRAQYAYASRMTNGIAVIGEPLSAQPNYYAMNHRYAFTASNYFVIDRKGNKITTEPHELIREFSENRAAFNKGGIWKQKRYSDNSSLVGGKWGYLDPNGKEIIAAIYDYVYDFKNGKAKVRLGERYFWIDTDGKECPPPTPGKTNSISIICQPGNFGYIDLKGNWAIEPQYYAAQEFSEGFAAVSPLRSLDMNCDDVNSVYDNENDLIHLTYSKPLRYLLSLGVDYNSDEYYSKDVRRMIADSIHMADSVRAVEMYSTRLYGYIDAGGIMVLPAKYEVALPFHNNRAYVCYRGKWGVINRKGDWVSAPVLDWPMEMADFSEGSGESTLENSNDDYFVSRVDHSEASYSNHLLAAKFYSMHEGVGGIYKYGKFGFIDSTGKIIVPPIYDKALPFANGFAAVCHGNHWGYIDKTGKEIIPLQYKSATSFSAEGLACVGTSPEKTGTGDVVDPSMQYESDYTVYYGFIDKTGKFAIKPQFISANGFSEGLAAVSVEYGKFGFIDKNGKFIIPPKYNYCSSFAFGFSLVRLNGFEPVLIDKTGKVSKIFTPNKMPVNLSKPLRRKTGSNNYFGFINEKGEEIISCQFANAGNFTRIK